MAALHTVFSVNIDHGLPPGAVLATVNSGQSWLAKILIMVDHG